MISPVSGGNGWLYPAYRRKRQRSRGKLARHLPVDPVVNFGGAEPPEFANVNPSDATEAGKSLKGLRVDFHDCGGLIRTQQRFGMRGAGGKKMGFARASPVSARTGGFFGGRLMSESKWTS
jgi:hypothetical protein